MKRVTTLLSLAVLGGSALTAQTMFTATFTTGGDDLRGGNDNVHIALVHTSGQEARFTDVNGRANWPNNSVRTVTRRLPDGWSDGSVGAVRVEFTGSGGMGGDNWNLDRLQVQVGAATILNLAGTPLFRFTGDQRVRLFPVTGRMVAPSPRRMTGFRPEQHGFRFVNSFQNIVFGDIRTSGLCGGMVYAALDYFGARRPIPPQDYMPAERHPLQSYLYNRQVNSLERNLDKWAEIGFNPGGARNREFFNWGLRDRIGELRAALDAGRPVPLGLQSCGNGCAGSHQVLAIGYEMGRYVGDLGANIEDFSIFVYDPNVPGATRTLKANVAGAVYFYAEDGSQRWRAYFVDNKYTGATPPVLPAEPLTEWIGEFVTGGDDLRGGNDNVHVVLLGRDGREHRFDNVNGRARWINNSSQSVARALPAGIRAADLVAVRLETTFGGGMGGDNWNLDRICLRVREGGAVRTILERSGAPLKRFTGSDRTLALEIR